MKMRTLITIALVVLLRMSAQAQQEFQFTQYMFNGLSLNPAYAGVHEGLSLSALWREQWVGFDGAPSTQFISVHSPLNYRAASLGAFFYRDRLGISEEISGYFSYAYRIQLTSTLKLSLGIQASAHNYVIDYGLAARQGPFDPGDLSVSDNFSTVKWNFGTGLLLHSDRLFVGFSVPQLLNKKLDTDDPDGTFSKLVRHFYGYAGVIFGSPQTVMFKPNILTKMVEGAPFQIDLNLNVLLKDLLWLGVSYRSFDSIDGLIALQITPQMQIGYSYDFTLTEIDAPSHEVMVNYVFNLPTRKILTPRYF